MRYLLTFLLLFFTVACDSEKVSWSESEALKSLFKEQGMEGTFVLYDVSRQRYVGFNKSRAEKRYFPAATFKIANALIGIATNSVKDVDEIIPYVGPIDPNNPWARDMSFRQATIISNHLTYQEVARRVGKDRMLAQLKKLNYGNAEIGEQADEFWILGPLKISAVEQVQFLSKLVEGKLPYPKEVQEKTKELFLTEGSSHKQLYDKTGSTVIDGKGLHWWVGWVYKNDKYYVFAANFDQPELLTQISQREFGKMCLSALEI